MPGTSAPSSGPKFFRVEGSGFLGLNEGGVGVRATAAYAFGRVFSIHLGMRLFGDDADIENDFHAGFGIRVNTAGPLAFTFTPELVLGEREKIGGGLRVGALINVLPDTIDLAAGLQVVGGDFDMMVLGDAGLVAYF